MAVRFIAYSIVHRDNEKQVGTVVEAIQIDNPYHADKRHYVARVFEFIDRHTAFGNLVTRQDV